MLGAMVQGVVDLVNGQLGFGVVSSFTELSHSWLVL